jgi:hypothetical protein
MDLGLHRDNMKGTGENDQTPKESEIEIKISLKSADGAE